MISFLMALAAQASPVPTSPEACAALVRTAPEKAVEMGNDWLVRGGGLKARQCLGLAYAKLSRWAPAATIFEQAAAEAETRKDPGLANLWVQAGNAWLASLDPAKARKAFDAALANPALAAELRGEVHLDRARAAVAAGDLASARADIDQGLKLVPADPFAWYLSSALALRERKVVRAREDIAKAVSLAPDDANVLLQAGTVASVSGERVAAQSFYEKAARLAPGTPAGRAARAALNPSPPAPKQ